MLPVIASVLGGVGLFLPGMILMTDGLLMVLESQLRDRGRKGPGLKVW